MSFHLYRSGVWWLYVARLFLGIAAGGISVITPIFISDISEETITSKLSGIFQIQFTLGILLQYILGRYDDLNLFHIGICRNVSYSSCNKQMAGRILRQNFIIHLNFATILFTICYRIHNMPYILQRCNFTMTYHNMHSNKTNSCTYTF